MDIGLPTTTSTKRPTSCKVNKEVEKMSKLKNNGLNTSKGNNKHGYYYFERKKIREDQSAMAFFALPKYPLLIAEAREYFTLQWYEKINKI